MRRALLSAMGIAALALSVPGAALAHGHHHHNSKSKAKARHARVHFEHIGAPAGSPQAGAPTVNQSTDTSSEPTGSSTETAGKIVSFKEGVLTIELNDKSTVSGKVTSRTEIECESAPTPSPQTTPEGTSGEDKGSGDDTSEGDKSAEEGDKTSGDSSEGTKEDDSEDGGQAPTTTEAPCDSSALTVGTVVREAELRISSMSGTEFESIQLIR